MYKKLLIVVIAFSIIISFMAGCTGKKASAEANQKANAKVPLARLVFYMAGEEKSDTKEVLDKVAVNSCLNIKLDFKWISMNKYNETINAAISSNEKFDAFLCGKPVPGGIDIADMFRKGKVKDITKLLPQYAPHILSQIPSDELNINKIDGKVAYIQPIIPIARTLGVWVRKDITAKYNITSINTFDDYEVLLQKIKNNEKNITPGKISDVSNLSMDLFANVYGYVILDNAQSLVYKSDDPTMKIIPWEQTPEFRKSVEYITRWYKNEYFLNGNGRGKFATNILRTSQYKEDNEQVDINNDGNEQACRYFILYKYQKVQKETPMDSIDLCSIAFSANSENVERSLMFLDWIQSNQKNYDLFNYGILGKDYKLKGQRVSIPSGNKSSYNGWYNIPFLNQNFIRLSVDDNVPDSEMEDTINFLNRYTKYPPSAGFYPDYRNLQEAADIRAQLLISKIIGPLNNGTYDMNYTDQVIQDIKSTDTDLIVRNIQEQLDKWKLLNNKNK